VCLGELEDISLSSFTKAVQESTSLERLHLSGMNGCRNLCGKIGMNPSVKQLYLTGVDAEGLASLGKELKRNNRISELRILGVLQDNEEEYSIFSEGIGENKSIEKLQLSLFMDDKAARFFSSK